MLLVERMKRSCGVEKKFNRSPALILGKVEDDEGDAL
jgi:hypothetical protein